MKDGGDRHHHRRRSAEERVLDGGLKVGRVDEGMVETDGWRGRRRQGRGRAVLAAVSVLTLAGAAVVQADAVTRAPSRTDADGAVGGLPPSRAEALTSNARAMTRAAIWTAALCAIDAGEADLARARPVMTVAVVMAVVWTAARRAIGRQVVAATLALAVDAGTVL